MDTKDWDIYYGSNIRFIQIDDELYSVSETINQDGATKLGEFTFTQGTHEISYNLPSGHNLINSPDRLNLAVDHGQKDLTFKLNNFDPYANYEISFKYFIEKGSGFQVYFNQDSDPGSDGKQLPLFSKNFAPDTYDFGEKTFVVGITPSPNATSAEFVVSAYPSNNCADIFQKKGVQKCKDPDFSYRYDRSTEVTITDLQIKKVLSSTPLLINHPKVMPDQVAPDITYEQIDPTSYVVTVSNARNSFMLVFSEIFNSGWYASFENGESINSSDHHLINGYANGWEVSRKGSYKIMLQFLPQKYLSIGKEVSLVSLGASIIIIGSIVLIDKRRNAKTS